MQPKNSWRLAAYSNKDRSVVRHYCKQVQCSVCFNHPDLEAHQAFAGRRHPKIFNCSARRTKLPRPAWTTIVLLFHMLPVIAESYRPHLGSFLQTVQIGRRVCLPNLRFDAYSGFGAQSSTHAPRCVIRRVKWMEMQSQRPEQVHR